MKLLRNTNEAMSHVNLFRVAKIAITNYFVSRIISILSGITSRVIFVAGLYYFVLFLLLVSAKDWWNAFHFGSSQDSMVVVDVSDTVVIAVSDENFNVILLAVEIRANAAGLVQRRIERLLILQSGFPVP